MTPHQLPPDHPDPDDNPDNGTPPHIAAEQAVIGCILLSPTALDDITDIITPADCYEPRHELILHAAQQLAATGTRPDPITIADHLGPNLRRAGGPAYLHHLATNAPIPESATHYAHIVKRHSLIRTIRATGHQLAQTPDTTPDNPHDIIDHARSTLDNIATGNTTTTPQTTAVYQSIETLEEPPGIPTPWGRLTDALAGWKPGSLTVIGARPSVGKSVFGAHITLDAARRGHQAPLFSMEMPRTEIDLRMIANIGTIDGRRIQHRKLTPTDWTNITQAADHLATLPIHIHDRPGLTITTIRAHLRTINRAGPLGPVVIDYLQLLTPPPDTPRNDRRVQVDAIARGLKNLAMDLRIPIIALAQLNRASEARADKTPTMADLRESGELEQAADNVILLHRDPTGAHTDPTELRVIIPKARHGAATQFALEFAGHYYRITEPGWTPTSVLDRKETA